jgi:hypothetical protein
MILVGIIKSILQLNANSWVEWILLAISVALSIIVIMFVYVLIFERAEFHQVIKRFKSMVLK